MFIVSLFWIESFSERSNELITSGISQKMIILVFNLNHKTSKMYTLRSLFVLLFSGIFFVAQSQKSAKENWESMFNGRDLSNWTPKITNYPAGENFGNTFRVEDKKIVVRYDAYDKFNDRFGHLFYNKQFSSTFFLWRNVY